ncbi:hypothetical protein [Bifidobacterium castoris]|uniref:Uncharacterized protein n=1 Tax=Bifidobacterium castoris TaxID=2306972 RepID=A0A430FAH0_9BIFI|nr:hypothetical protein [Bifidobacterium castoris]RSX49831.1 hypothetical protein D2E22_0292 [Bifidobacterium castoris]
MGRPYSVMFRVSETLWLTTVGGEDTSTRARTRARLRGQARAVWRRALVSGAYPVRRFVLLVLVGGRSESPVLAAETLKPLIDAGTDEGVWPDDDPEHRIMTAYARDPRPMSGRGALIHMVVFPAPDHWRGAHARRWLMGSAGRDVRGVLPVLDVPDAGWLTSNMRLPAGERRARQSMVMGLAAPLWRRFGSPGPHVGVVASVGYPDPRYWGDPDNTAETLTAMYGAGVALGRVPPVPDLFAFVLDPDRCEPRHHHVALCAYSLPEGYMPLSAMLADPPM